MEQLQSPLSKTQKVLNDKGRFYTLLYFQIATVPPLDYIHKVSFKLIKSVRACRLHSLLCDLAGHFCITVDCKENLFIQVENELICKAALFYLNDILAG